MPELDQKLWFDIIPCDRHLLLRLHVTGPYIPVPVILEKLLELLRSTNEAALLSDRFPDDKAVLKKVEAVLAGSAVRPERVSGVHYGCPGGHSVHVQIDGER